MSEMEWLDEPAGVVAISDAQGRITPRQLMWRDHDYTIISVGRQWDGTAGRHVLVEAAGGTRFELQLRRDDLTWRVRRVWWGQVLV